MTSLGGGMVIVVGGHVGAFPVLRTRPEARSKFCGLGSANPVGPEINAFNAPSWQECHNHRRSGGDVVFVGLFGQLYGAINVRAFNGRKHIACLCETNMPNARRQ
jgi:hypothetical protein